MIEEVLPSKVASAESLHDPEGVQLFPEEAASIGKAVHKRRQEFTTVRHCARRALAALGHPPAPLVPGESGAPVWPGGVVGSMTHCTGYRAAAVAHRTAITTVGVDAEPDEALPDGVLERIALPEEQRALEELAGSGTGTHWDRLLFSAKESVYKAWFPITSTWLGFEDATVEIDPAAGTFHVRILVSGNTGTGEPAPRELPGRWLARGGLVLTAIALPASS